MLKKELHEEQRIEELKRIADAATGKDRHEKLDWMYTVRKVTSEDYLKGTMAKTEEKELEQLAKAPGSLWLHSTNSTKDAENKIKDDPLLQVKMEQQKALKNILNNPVQMKKIKESKKVQKLLKKLEKKKKKLEKLKNEAGENPSGSEDEKAKDGGSNGVKSEHSETRKRERSRSRSRSNSPKRRKDERDNNHRDNSHRDNSHRDRDNRDRRGPDYRDHRDRNGRDRDSERWNKDTSDRRNDRNSKVDSQDKRSDSNPRRNGGDRKRPMSEEERKKRLEDMMKDSEEHEEKRWKRIKNATEEDKNLSSGAIVEPDNRASFLNDLNKKVYTQHDEDLADRVRRNIHQIERTTGDSLANEERGIF